MARRGRGRRQRDRDFVARVMGPDDAEAPPPRRYGRELAPFGPPLPPPEHGIKVRHVGATWWGERWVAALVRFGRHYAARLQRGRSYARQGRVHDLTVTGNVVSASVTGSRPEPYRVTIRMKELTNETWQRAIAAMARKARFAAHLLGGEMPREIEQAFAGANATLFPARAADLKTKCSCPDPANPCKHIAALHFVLGEAFDRDPFLLFELRGRSKEDVLAALRAQRGGSAARAASAADADAAEARAMTVPHGVPVSELAGVAYDAFRQPVDDLHFRITAPATEGAIVRHLGSPPGWSLDEKFAELVQPTVARAAYLAREMALGVEPEPAPAPPAPRRRRG